MKQYGSSVLRLRNLSVCVVILLSSILAAAQHETILHSFGTQPDDGELPSNALIADAAGNLYGSTALGGANRSGIIFELSPPVSPSTAWTETILYSFGGSGVGDGAAGALVLDGAGNLYGTSGGGDSANCGSAGCGIVFELSPPQNGGSWTITTLYNFVGLGDGEYPEAGLVFDSAGNLYGTTGYGGGKGTCTGPPGFTGCGTVFELSPPSAPGGAWTETVLYAFSGGDDGGVPVAPVTIDKSGNLLGTTAAGGTIACEFTNCGTVYELALTTNGWEETVIHDFGSFLGDGFSPGFAGLFLDNSGAIAGTTPSGGLGQAGTVFGLLPPASPGRKWNYGVIYSFTKPKITGVNPRGSVVVVNGTLYGTTADGGDAGGSGTVFRLARMMSGIWKETGLYSFGQSPDGYSPQAGPLIFRGALYGTTIGGGTENLGTIYRITP